LTFYVALSRIVKELNDRQESYMYGEIESTSHYLAGIPGWAYFFVVMLIYMAFQSTRPIIVPIKRLLVLPLIFIPLSMFVILYLIPLNFLTIGSWIAACVIGIVTGWYQIRALRVRAIKDTQSLHVPGTWSFLLILAGLAVVKFYVHYKFSYIDPQIVRDPLYAPWFMAAYGVLTGLFIGRIGHAFYRIKHGPFVERATLTAKPAP
jgi:hypothetical protein